MEYHLNKNDQSVTDFNGLLSDIINIVHENYPKVEENDCLMSKCQILVQNLTMNSSDNLPSDTFKCSRRSCSGLKNFLDFFEEVKAILLLNTDKSLNAYHDFIISKLDLGDSKFGPQKNHMRNKNIDGDENYCAESTMVDCSVLLTDFRFLEKYDVSIDIERVMKGDDGGGTVGPDGDYGLL